MPMSAAATRVGATEEVVPRHWIPMRRLDLARLAVFTDPFSRLGRPVSDIVDPVRIILEDDDFPVPRCGFNRTAHVKDAYSELLLHFAILRPYPTRGGAQSTPFGTPFSYSFWYSFGQGCVTGRIRKTA